MSVHEHKEKGKKSVRCFVITVSDTRDEATDTSGQAIKSLLGDSGHQTHGYRIVKDEPAQIEALLNEALGSEAIDAVTLNVDRVVPLDGSGRAAPVDGAGRSGTPRGHGGAGADPGIAGREARRSRNAIPAQSRARSLPG